MLCSVPRGRRIETVAFQESFLFLTCPRAWTTPGTFMTCPDSREDVLKWNRLEEVQINGRLETTELLELAERIFWSCCEKFYWFLNCIELAWSLSPTACSTENKD